MGAGGFRREPNPERMRPVDMKSSLPVIPAGLLAMIRCAFMPWRAPSVFTAYERANAANLGKAFLAAGLALFFAVSVLRNVGFEHRPLIPLLIKMIIVVIVPMLISFPGALVLAGVSIGVDALLLVLFILGISPHPGIVGVWEIGALCLCYFFVWRARRLSRNNA